MKFETFDDSLVTLDTYNSDLSLVIDASRYSAHPLTNEGFAFMWAGVRSTHGVTKGKICYEVKIVKNLDVNHLPADEPNPHVVRVGFSIEKSPLQLGEDPLSYGYGGTGKISTNCQFKNYGTSFGENDVVMGLLNMDSNPVEIGFAKNGQFLGWAYKVNKKELDGQALFPHILTKNCSFEVNFGQRDQPYFKCPAGYDSYKFIGCIPADQREHGTKPPSRRQDCEMIMMCGLPGCGKTVWATEYAKKNPDKKYNVLGTNNIIDKMKVMGLPRKRNYHGRWDVLIQMATKCLNKFFDIASKLNRNYILDQTNVYESARRRKMRQFNDFFKTVIVIVPTEEEFKRRCDKRDREEGEKLPEHALLEMKANFKLPIVGDIFDKVTYTELQPDEARNLVATYNLEGKSASNPSKRFKPNEPSPAGRNTSGPDRGGQNTGFGGRQQSNQGGDFGGPRNVRGGGRGGFDSFGRGGDDKGFDSGFRSGGGERGFSTDSGFGSGSDSGFGRGGGMDKRGGRGGRGSGFDGGYRGRGGGSRGGFDNSDNGSFESYRGRGSRFDSGFRGRDRGGMSDDMQYGRSDSPSFGGNFGRGGSRGGRGQSNSGGFSENFDAGGYSETGGYSGYGNDSRGGRGGGGNVYRGMGGNGGRGSNERGRGGNRGGGGFGSRESGDGFNRRGGYGRGGGNQSGFDRESDSGSFGGYGETDNFSKGGGYGNTPSSGFNKGGSGGYDERGYGYDASSAYGSNAPSGGYDKDSGYGGYESGSQAGSYDKRGYGTSGAGSGYGTSGAGSGYGTSGAAGGYGTSGGAGGYGSDGGYGTEYPKTDYSKGSEYGSSASSYNVESGYSNRGGEGRVSNRGAASSGDTSSRMWSGSSQQGGSQNDYQSGGQSSYGSNSMTAGSATSGTGTSGYGSYDSSYGAGYGTQSQGYSQYGGYQSKGSGSIPDKSWGSSANPTPTAASSQGSSGAVSQSQWSQWSQPPPPPPPPAQQQQYYGQSAGTGSSAYGTGTSGYGSASSAYGTGSTTYGSAAAYGTTGTSSYGPNSYSTK